MLERVRLEVGEARRLKEAHESGWNGRPARPRRQLAAELRGERSSHKGVAGARRSGGRVSRRDGPVARSTQNSDVPRSKTTPIFYACHWEGGPVKMNLNLKLI